MIMARPWIVAAFLAVMVAGVAAGKDEKPVVKDFTLLDAQGQKHTPAEWKDAKAVVLLFLATECPVSNSYSPECQRLAKAFCVRGVLVWGVYSDPDVTAETAARHGQDYSLTFPRLLDPAQTLAKAAGVRVTPEAVVLTPDGRVKYRGRIDDRYTEDGKRRDEPRVRDLVNAVDAVLDGKEPNPYQTKAFGCPLPPAKP
jgi:peroxiredoxin